jgi:hypothetical protein
MIGSLVMPVDQILGFLIAERDRLNRAIEALQGSARRRGRPPKNPLMFPSVVSVKRKSRTAAQKKAQSEKMKLYWAQRKKREKS